MAEVNAAGILCWNLLQILNSGMVNGKTQLENFIQDVTIPFADSELRHTAISSGSLSLVLEGAGEPIQAQSHQKLLHCERTLHWFLHYFVHTMYFLCFVFFCFFFLGFVCRSMPMLEKLSMPLAVRLAGITNCHVFVHALRTIKWKISYLQYNSHVITHIH